MVFGTNNPLYQNAYKPNNEKIYTNYLQELINGISIEGDDYCEICGETYGLDIDHAWKNVCEKHNLNYKERKYVGRDTFPLIGSIGNDAQALPVASKVQNVCPKCLFAVNFLPLSTSLLKGKLTCYESTSEELLYGIISTNTQENLNLIRTGNKEILGKKDGTFKIFENFLSLMDMIEDYRLSEYEAIYIWNFSNSGTGADCVIIEIPNKLLKFLYKLSKEETELRNEFLGLLQKDKGNWFFDSIINSLDSSSLYPFKKNPGISLKLYEIYQTEIVGRTKENLQFAQKIALKLLEGKDQKEIEKLRTSDLFKEISNQNRVRKLIIDMVLENEAEFDDYIGLFNPKNEYLRRSFKSDYDPIMYYIYNLSEVKL
jgi:CRISPR-associated protein (Cas_CXXC_CXXC).